MKKFIILLIVCAFTEFTYSQGITLTYHNYVPLPGEIYVSLAADTTNVTVDSGGANHVWDYSYLSISTDKYYDSFIAPDTTPYFTSFPNSTGAMNKNSTYYYYKGNLNEYVSLGAASTTSIMADSAKVIVFPFKYKSQLYDSSNFVNVIDFDSLHILTKTYVVADGWGTLKLPGKTFTNVLRLYTYSYGKDTSDIISMIDSSKSYSWYDGNHKEPILSIGFSSMVMYLSGMPPYYFTNKTVYVLDTGEISNIISPVVKPSLPTINVYPNPAADYFYVSLNVKSNSKVNISLLSSISNESVTLYSKEAEPGLFLEKFSVKTLPKGMYLVNIIVGNDVYYQKIVIQ